MASLLWPAHIMCIETKNKASSLLLPGLLDPQARVLMAPIEKRLLFPDLDVYKSGINFQ